jgi:hypothetical protein
VAVLVWLIVRAAAVGAPSSPGPRADETAAWPQAPRSQEPVITVTPSQPTDEVAEMIRENNRLLREILEELRRRPQASHLGASEHPKGTDPQ